MTETWVGRVRNFQQRQQRNWTGRQYYVWSFNLATWNDYDGQWGPVIPVEIEALNFKGSINLNDIVELEANWKPGKIIRVKQVFNMTTQVKVGRS